VIEIGGDFSDSKVLWIERVSKISYSKVRGRKGEEVKE